MYNNLNAELARRKITKKSIADLFGLNRNCIYKRMNGTMEFSVKEIQLIRDTFMPEITLDYLTKRG